MDIEKILALAVFVYLFYMILKFIVKVCVFFTPPKKCGICKSEFGNRATIYEWSIEGKNLNLCSTCNRKMKSKTSSKKFDEFFNGDSGSNNSNRRQSIPSSVL